MIYNYFQINKKQNQILTSLLQSENPDVTNLKSISVRLTFLVTE